MKRNLTRVHRVNSHKKNTGLRRTPSKPFCDALLARSHSDTLKNSLQKPHSRLRANIAYLTCSARR